MKFLNDPLYTVRCLLPFVLCLLLNFAVSAGKLDSLARSKNLVQSSRLEHSIRKRDVAEVIVTDTASRGSKDRLRKVIFQRLLSLVDDSMGGKCSSKLNKGSHKKSRDCNLMRLFGAVARRLGGGGRHSGLNSGEIENLIAGLDHHSRRKLLRMASYHMKHVRRKKMIQSRRRHRAYLRRLKRAKKLRENRRAVFDGKPMFWM